MAMYTNTALSISSAVSGTRFSSDHYQLGRAEQKLTSKLRNQCVKGNQWFFWQTPRIGNFNNFNARDLPLHFAYGKDAEDSPLSNLSEDTDEMFDSMFKKYGKVVFRRNDQKPPSAEVDDDAESLSFHVYQMSGIFLLQISSSTQLVPYCRPKIYGRKKVFEVAVAMARVASDVKAADVKVLFVKPLVYWTRFFIIATAFSRPQIDAIGSRIRDLAEKKYGKVPSGDSKPNSWTLLDFGEVVIHIFLPQQRAFYNLEEFYGNATPIELPFENQPPFQG